MATKRGSTGRPTRRRASGAGALPLARRRFEVVLKRGRLVRVTVNGRPLAPGLPVVLRVRKGDTVCWRSLAHDHVVNFASRPVLGTKNVMVEVGTRSAPLRPVGTGPRGRASTGSGSGRGPVFLRGHRRLVLAVRPGADRRAVHDRSGDRDRRRPGTVEHRCPADPGRAPPGGTPASSLTPDDPGGGAREGPSRGGPSSPRPAGRRAGIGAAHRLQCAPRAPAGTARDRSPHARGAPCTCPAGTIPTSPARASTRPPSPAARPPPTWSTAVPRLQRRAPARGRAAAHRAHADRRRHRGAVAHRRADARGARHERDHPADRGRLRRLDRLDRREPVPRHALRARARDAPGHASPSTTSSCARRASCASTTSSSTTRCCSTPTRSSARSSRRPEFQRTMSTAEFHYLCGKYLRAREEQARPAAPLAARGRVRVRRADLHLLARRLVDRHERRRQGARGQPSC